MGKSRQALARDRATEWAECTQVYVIEALLSESAWTSRQLIFHGGTSLHLSWRSPRFSEDLDFLIARHVQTLPRVMARVRQRVEEHFLGEDAHFRLEMRDRTRDPMRMGVFEFVVSHPQYVGRVRVKAEFWFVDAGYLEQYPTSYRSVLASADVSSRISQMVPAATLDAAFCDKLTAFATRPYLKWRDVYDLWWIGTQTSLKVDVPQLIPQFLHHLSAYQTRDLLPVAQALRQAAKDPALTVAQAEIDLKPWFSESIWRFLHPQVTAEMVGYAAQTLAAVAALVEQVELIPGQKREGSAD